MEKIMILLTAVLILLPLIIAREPITEPEPICCIPNPATVYCLDNGYDWEVRENEYGQYGVCIDSCGNECEEWQFYRGECNFPVYNFWYIDGKRCLKNKDCMLPSYPTYETKKECRRELIRLIIINLFCRR